MVESNRPLSPRWELAKSVSNDRANFDKSRSTAVPPYIRPQPLRVDSMECASRDGVPSGPRLALSRPTKLGRNSSVLKIGGRGGGQQEFLDWMNWPNKL